MENVSVSTNGVVPRRKINMAASESSFRELPEIVVNAPSTSDLTEEQIGNNNSKDLIDGNENNSDDRKGDEEFDENYKRPPRRKNSISLPNLDDIEYLKAQQLLLMTPCQESMNSSEFGNSVISDDETTPINRRVYTRNYRRKSVTDPPAKMLKPPNIIDDDDIRSNSPSNNSVASVNSLASLLKEKLQAIPANKKKNRKNFKIKAIVGFLFLLVVALIGLAYIVYDQKNSRKAFFEKVKFSPNDRLVNIYNNEGVEVLRARLGTTLRYAKVFPCLKEYQKNDGSVCLEWMNHARLYISTYNIQNEIPCYNFLWISQSEDIEPTDCFDLSPRTGHWYGGGQTAEDAWPLAKGFHNFSPFITGVTDKYEWGNVLKRFFINSKGATVLINENVPLYTSINADHKQKELCFRAKYDDFAYVNRFTPFPLLNYSVCTGPNMTRLYSFFSEKSLWDGLKQEDINVIHSLVSEPLWEIGTDYKSELTEETVTNFTEDVTKLGYLKLGHVLINEFWQKQPGDFEVDKERFPTLEETIDMMHRRGFRIAFSVQPFISTESFNFFETVKRQLLISERFSDRRIPALTRYKSINTAGVLDMTNQRAVPWLLRKLIAVKNKYKFDAFYLDLGVAYDMPHYYQCENSLINPDQYKTIFINNLEGSVPIFGVNSAVQRPQPPAFVSLPPFESSWNGLRKVIPTILTYGLSGYPFLIPGAVGGDYEPPEYRSKINLTAANDSLLPDKELYMRWLQLATFLPVVRYRNLPNKYGDANVLEMAKFLSGLRQRVVTPLLRNFTNVALDSGLPLIRPLWMLSPNDPACHIVTDEFSIGDKLIVAPVLYPKMRQREVYLPAGVWKDGIGGSLRKGNRWIHDYVVEEGQIAYFEKKPDDTRF